MKNPTVAQILPALNYGGVERGTIEVANYLAENNCYSIVISAGGQLTKELHAEVEHIQLDIGKKSLFTLFKVNKLKRILIEKKIDIVHARSRLPAWIAHKAIAKMANKPKFFTTVHGLYSVKRYSSIMARGDEVIAVSNTAKSYVESNYQKYLKKPVNLIYRGIDPKSFPYQVIDKEFERNLFDKHPKLLNKKLVLLPGRLSSLKGLTELKDWLKETNAVLLLTATQHSNPESIKANQWLKQNQFSEKVCWVGFQSKVAKLYSVVDIVLSPSTRPESFGRTVAESLATGTPVIGYNHGGVSEILSKIFPHGLVPAGNTKSLSNAIEAQLANPKPVPNLQPFLLSDMLESTLNLYRAA